MKNTSLSQILGN